MTTVIEPIEVEIANRGEGAATGPGLVIGIVGVLITLMIVALASVVLLVAVIPMLIVWLIARTLQQTVRLDARFSEWADEMGLVSETTRDTK